MHFFAVIVTSVAVGFFAALPIGPVNLLCIRRTLAFGTIFGFVAGLGAAVADGIFAAVISFGLTFLKELIEGYKLLLELVGSTLLVSFGIRAFFAKPHFRDPVGTKVVARSTQMGSIASTFALAITNPATLIGFTAMFSSASFWTGEFRGFDPLLVVGGVTGGSTLWWLTLCTMIGRLHHSITDHTMGLINKVSGVVIALFGLVVFGGVVATIFKL